MVKSIQYPQEVEVFYLIPAIRRELAAALKADGLEQKRIAKLLNISDAAVSQYFSAKRGSSITFNDAMKAKIKKIALKLKTHEEVRASMQELLKLSLNEGVTCELHKLYSAGIEIEDDCSVCFDHKQKKS